MVQKELLQTKFFVFIFCLVNFIGCNETKQNVESNVFEKVDVSQIPNNTIYINDSSLKLNNGVYFYGGKPYSGLIKEIYTTDTLKFIGYYFEGKQQGSTKTFFENGKLETERNYKDGIGYGRHYGYWKNGHMKFDFSYFNDKREGIQKQWYESGSNYYALNYTNDQENGMQKAWRENGKPYINYEVKDGLRYGLQKSALCYTLKDQEIK